MCIAATFKHDFHFHYFSVFDVEGCLSHRLLGSNALAVWYRLSLCLFIVQECDGTWLQLLSIGKRNIRPRNVNVRCCSLDHCNTPLHHFSVPSPTNTPATDVFTVTSAITRQATTSKPTVTTSTRRTTFNTHTTTSAPRATTSTSNIPLTHHPLTHLHHPLTPTPTFHSGRYVHV